MTTQCIHKSIRCRAAHMATPGSHTSLHAQPSLTGVNRCRIIGSAPTPPITPSPTPPSHASFPPSLHPSLARSLSLHLLIHLYYLHPSFLCPAFRLPPSNLISPHHPSPITHSALPSPFPSIPSFLSISPVCFHHASGSFLLPRRGSLISLLYITCLL